MSKQIYKIMSIHDWDVARTLGQYFGSEHDARDGFIHFSTTAQVVETANKHFSGQENLVLLAVDVSQVEDGLKWEPSRGGDLFPHLYRPLPASAVVQSWPLPLNEHGEHQFPEDMQ